MKKYLFIILIVLSSIVQAQKPLKIVNTDSIIVEDFFWFDMLDSIAVLYPQLKAEQLDITPKVLKKYSKLNKSFDELEPRLSLTGCEKGLLKSHQRQASAQNIVRQSFQLALITRQAKYFDYCERALFNEIAAAWHDPQGDKKKVSSVIASVPQMIYAADGKDIYINLLVRNVSHIVTDQLDFKIRNMTSIPWYCQNMMTLNMDKPQEFTLHIRIPSWVTTKDMLPSYTVSTNRNREADININGEIPDVEQKDGYYVIHRVWKNGDIIKYNIPSPVIRLRDKELSKEVALQRGPLIFAFEDVQQIKFSDGISNKFDHTANTIYLTSKKYDEQEKSIGQYKSLPYFWNREKYFSLINAKFF